MHKDFTYNNFSNRNYLTEVGRIPQPVFTYFREIKQILVHLLSAELTFFLVFHESMHQNTFLLHKTYEDKYPETSALLFRNMKITSYSKKPSNNKTV